MTKKKIKIGVIEQAMPYCSFDAGTVIDRPALVVDVFGIGWWVDPTMQTIRPVKMEK